MYKVFVNHKEIILTTSAPKSAKAKVLALDKTPLTKIIRILKTTKIQKLYLTHHDPASLIHLFKQKLPVTTAGGGVVRNQKNELLFIFRKKKWDLPKGRIEKKESLEAGAKREVKEETGVKKLRVGALAGKTFHVFKRNNRYQLKETYWFYMETTYAGKLVPEIKEDISKAVWKNYKKAKKALGKTYPNINHLFEKIALLKSLSEQE
jgi:ADP-ribose pyrophosphatase YjhB (NUDIX family)